MKAIQQLAVRTRSAARAFRARHLRPGWPGHLVLRLDGFDAPGPVEARIDLAGWQERVVRLVRAMGPTPVRVIAAADHPWLVELVRFANRLECPVTVRTGPAGLGGREAAGLVDAGVRRVLVVGADPAGAVRALAQARGARGAVLDIVVEIPFAEAARFREIAGDARAAGADGARLGAPWTGGPYSAAQLAALAEAAEWVASFHRLDREALAAAGAFGGDAPGTPRAEGHCPVAGLRLELRPDGTALACPFQPGAVAFDGEAEALYEGLAAHRAAIRACGRACWHPETR